MEEQAINIIKSGFRSFQPVIRFRTNGDPSKSIRQAISQDPSIIYYLHSCSVLGGSGGYEIRAQYIHKDTDRSDIQIVLSQYECENLICQYAGSYRKKLIVIAKDGLDLSVALKEFHEKHGSFYPNLTNIKGMIYHLNTDYSVFEFSFEYRIGRVKLAQMEQEVKDEVERIAELLFRSNMPVEAKIYLAHNYLAVTTKYVNNDDNRLDLSYTQSAYGALIKKQCVCQGFAEAFKRLMDSAGVDCTVIYGQVTGSSTLHAWNLVAVNSESNYYHIDVTWDAAGDKPGYLYFCKNDAYFKGKRSWNKQYNPVCAGSYPVLAIARKYVLQNKEILIAGGIDQKILDC